MSVQEDRIEGLSFSSVGFAKRGSHDLDGFAPVDAIDGQLGVGPEGGILCAEAYQSALQLIGENGEKAE